MGDHIPDWAATPKGSGKCSLSLVSQPPKDSDAEPQSWHVDKQAAYLLGRNGQAVDACIAHKSASRVHACLAYDRNGHLYLVDLGSAHGTFLNGERLDKHGKARVVGGDTITLAACPTVYTLESTEHVHRGGNDAEQDSQAANGAASEQSPARSERSDRHGAAKDGSNGRRHVEQEAREERSRRGPNGRSPNGCSRNGRSPDGRRANGRKQRSRSSERAAARNGGQRRDGDQHLTARRSPDAAKRVEGNHGRDGRPSRDGSAGRRSPVLRPSPVPKRPEGPRGDQRRRRSPSPAGDRRKRRRSLSRSRSPARQRKRDEPSAAQKQRERQAAFRDPPAPAPPPVPAGNPIDIGELRIAGGWELPHAEDDRLEDAARSCRVAAPEQDLAEPPDPNQSHHVRSMMGTPAGGLAMAVEQKKKLLWGAKKAEAPAHGAIAGHNRWDTAEFSTDADKDKFQRLMGVKRADDVAPAAAQAPDPLFDRHLPQKEQQERLQGELERNFLEGVRRGNRHTVGLGL